MGKVLLAIGAIVVVGVLVWAFTRSSGGDSTSSQSTTSSVTTSESAASTANYQEYSAAAYEQAREQGSPVFLFFHADWCPTCHAQEPGVQEIFAGLTNDAVGFRVDYDTEKALKSEFRVTLQHTMILLDSSGNEAERWIGTVPQSTLEQAITNVN